MVTNFTGGKSMHSVLLTTGNIIQSVRGNVGSGSVTLMAEIPTYKFPMATRGLTEKEAKQRGAFLNRRLYHKCLSIAFESLRKFHPSRSPDCPRELMVDARGYLRVCFPNLMIWCADLEEQNDILCLARGSSPKSEARHHTLDAPRGTNQARTGESILKTIRAIRRAVGPDASVWTFGAAAKDEGLNGVEEPFWRELYGDFCRILSIEALHTFDKGWYDHVFDWISRTISSGHLDARLMAQPHVSGYRNFWRGIIHLSQFSGREHRDLRRHILPAITGHIKATPAVLKTVRASLDFIQKAQYRLHTSQSLAAMSLDLKTFEANRSVFIKNGGRQLPHFRIPKLELWRWVEEDIRRFGGLAHGDASFVERMHIDFFKRPFQRTSRGPTYRAEVLKKSILAESMALFTGYLSLVTAENDPQVYSDLHRLKLGPELTDSSAVLRDSFGLAKKPLPVALERLVEALSPDLGKDGGDLISALVRKFCHGEDGMNRRVKTTVHRRAEVPRYLSKLNIWTCFRLSLLSPNECYPSQLRLVRCRPPLDKRGSQYDTVLVDADNQFTDMRRKPSIFVLTHLHRYTAD